MLGVTAFACSSHKLMLRQIGDVSRRRLVNDSGVVFDFVASNTIVFSDNVKNARSLIH